MNKKDIQEQRIKSYFIETAKKMIKGEGIKIVSVRRVADEAGYSYATIYNHFKNLNDLIFHCVKDFLEECRQEIVNATHPNIPGEERIKSKTLSYVRYFIQYPGIFELLFIEPMSAISNQEGISNAVYNFLDDVLAEDWKVCIEKGTIYEKNLDNTKSVFKLTIHGLMLFYINRSIPKDYKDFMKEINEKIDFILS